LKTLPQASVAVATANTGVAGQEMVLGAGRAAITRRGGVNHVDRLACRAAVAAGIDRRPGARHVVRTSAGAISRHIGKGQGEDAAAGIRRVAVANTGVAGQEMVLVAGRAAITGAVVSITLIVWRAVLLLPHASTAVQVRVTL